MRGSTSNRGLFGVLLLLLIVVAVPTAGVLWFMSVAMRNERLAVRQTLTAAYQAQLATFNQQLHGIWEKKEAALVSVDPSKRAGELFAELIRADVADSVVLSDAEGTRRYPADPEPQSFASAFDSPEWLEAQELEFGQLRHVAAANLYGRIAREASDVNDAARALQAQARCLGKAGRKESAVGILTEKLVAARFRGAVDGQGRLIVADTLLMALHLLEDPAASNYRATANRLRARLEDYGDPPMPSAQRRFLMRQFQELMPAELPFDTLAAEDMAARYVEADVQIFGPGLNPSGLPHIWQLVSSDGTTVALFHQRTVQALLRDSVRLPGYATVQLLPPGAEAAPDEPFLSVATGGHLSGWRLALYLSDQDHIDAAADAQISAYFWTGVLVVAIIASLALLIARAIGRQIRLARLKNNLVATVSHELKTPLASMRLLVDTLLDKQGHDESEVREYLELISRENARLSHLVDDFLTFSRMERNKQVFEKKETPPKEIATAAAEAVRGRFDPAHCRLDVDIAPDLPNVIADQEAMVTAMVNLLDNAYKYSKDEKHIIFRAYPENKHVCFAVQDNGIGLSRRAARRVFDRFYQADDGLARSAGGVGLGLSIVKFIVNAHGGQVDVVSQPSKGCIFTIKLPAARSAAGPA